MRGLASVHDWARPHLRTLRQEAFAIGTDLFMLVVLLGMAALGIGVAILTVGVLITVSEGVLGIVLGWTIAIGLGILVPILAFRAAAWVYELAGL
jgi:hypothetical protein